LRKSGVVHTAMSEDKPTPFELNPDGEYTITFDPIEGSAVIDSNFAVATLFAVWKAKDINGLRG